MGPLKNLLCTAEEIFFSSPWSEKFIPDRSEAKHRGAQVGPLKLKEKQQQYGVRCCFFFGSWFDPLDNGPLKEETLKILFGIFYAKRLDGEKPGLPAGRFIR